LGFFAGLIGSLIFKTYLSEVVFPEFREINISNGLSDNGLIIRDARKVIVEQNDKIMETINSISPSLVGIYKKSDIKNAGKNSLLLNKYLFQGIIITSDGWIASDFGSQENIKIADYAVIANDKKIYNIEKIIHGKDFGLNFLRIKAVGLPVLTIAKINDTREGEMTLSLNWSGHSNIGFISKIETDSREAAISSENNAKRIKLTEPLPKIFNGSALFSLSGSICGFINGRSSIVPAAYLENNLKSILKLGSIKKPLFGASYIDLSRTAAGQLSFGALIHSIGTSAPAILPKSPAESADLKEGDIIISVNNESLDSKNDLSLLIGKYLPGDSINFKFVRDKKELYGKAILGELK
jgi:hypothetical protein